MKKIIIIMLVIGLAALYWFTKAPNWNKNAMQDVDKIYQLLLENHPGSIDPQNPGFKETLNKSYQLASNYAKQVTNSAGHLYALRSLTKPFHDLHLTVGFFQAAEREFRWPGFAVNLAQDSVVVVRKDVAEAPDVGARLISCDGQSFAELMSQRIIPFIGNWAVNSLKVTPALYLFIDSANPFIGPMNSCVFEHNNVAKEYVLNWQNLDDKTFDEILDTTRKLVKVETGLRFLDDGTVWISIASFGNSNPQDVEVIDQLLTGIDNNRAAISSAPAMVFDVRGNGGGSSLTGLKIASAIWGEDYINDKRPRIDSVNWRASDFNIEQLETFLPYIKKANGAESEVYQIMNELHAGMQSAQAAGMDYFVQEKSYPVIKQADSMTVPENVYFLTDSACVSACLDFADLMMNLNVTHVGHETAGDTSYLEVLNATLPSGVAQLTYPTAVHRGRDRGDNESYVPEFIFEGDISDNLAIEQWLVNLK